jgi:hypothetical protein
MDQGIHMARFKARLEKTDGKFQEIQMVRTKQYRWQDSMNTGGKDQEIQMARFKKSRSDGKVQEIQMAMFKEYRW